jgi:signal transduction histidine kinase
VARSQAEWRREELERVTESRAGLIRGFGHDVKNPLAAADGYLQLLEQSVMGEVTEGQKQSIARARRSLSSALALIDDLIELARAEGVDVVREPVDLGALLVDLVEENRARASAKGLELAEEMPPESVRVETDPRRVRQVIGNLLSNAIKYTDRGRITIRLQRRDRNQAGRTGRWAAVRVSDTGPGIPREEWPRLFREFNRLAPAAGTEGMGIGLAISRRLARALGGDITIESEVGFGSTFSLWLPLES